MTDAAPSLVAATARARAARMRLSDTWQVVQYRISPDTLMREGRQGLQDRALNIGEDLADQARARPGTALAVIAAVIIFVSRDRIAHLVEAAFRRAPKPQDELQASQTDSFT